MRRLGKVGFVVEVLDFEKFGGAFTGRSGDFGGVNLDKVLTENAAECGLRSILILLGILNHIKFQTKILSYEAPFGVGYLVANLELP